MKRRQGRGSVTPLADGRFWVRGPRQPDGSRPSLGYVSTLEDAEAILSGAVHAIATRGKEGCSTFEEFGQKILDERELDGVRGVGQERSRFKAHLATAHFAKKALDQITTPDGAEWLRAMARKEANDRRGRRKLSKATVQRALSLALVIFDAAGPQNHGLIDKNPFLGLEARGTVTTADKWTFLTLEEQRMVASYVAPPDDPFAMQEHERLAILFGAGSGVRQGEQFNLELADLHVEDDEKEPRAAIRYGSKDKTVKNEKPYEVPLFGIALDAARAWLKLRTAYLTNAKGAVAKTSLVFCSPSGTRRAVGKPLGNGRFIERAGGTHVLRSGKPLRVEDGKGTHVYFDRLKEVLRQCGIARNVRWHDMRHTCASSLIRGDWGEAVRIEVVKDMLNHSTIAVTQRYAHLGPTPLKDAAAKIRVGYGLVGKVTGGASAMGTITNDLEVVGRAGLEPATYGLKGPGIVELLRGLSAENGAHNQLVTNLAETLAVILEGEAK